jgi:hypothetical protein
LRSWLGPTVSLLLVAAAATAYWRFAARPPARSAERTHIEISGDKFDFDPRYLSTGRDDGGVELVASFPDFAPAAAVDDVTAHTDIDERFGRLVFVGLKAADPKLDPAERTERLYLRFLDETSWSHPGGLVARAFEAGSPFEGDELFFVPPAGRQFAARCHRSEASRNLPNTCIAAFRNGAVDAQVRFSADRLSDWEALMKGANGLIEAARR